MNKQKLQYRIIYILCAVMPLHSMVIDKVIGNHTAIGLINLWRDLLIVILMFSVLKASNKIKGIHLISFLGIIWIFFNVFIALLSKNTTTYLSLNMARIYIVPILLYLAVSNINLNGNQYSRLITLFWVQGVLLTLFGIFQVFVLGSSFLTDLGYGSNGALNYTYYIGGFYGYQRMVSTFSSANDCGLYLSGLFIISLIEGAHINEKYKKIYPVGLMIIYMGIILTFSRTSLIAVTLTGLVYYLKVGRQYINPRTIKKYCTIFLLFLVISIFIDAFCLNSRIVSMITSSITSTVTRSDLSFLKHLEDLYLPVFDLIKHPFGYGFGTNGPVALSVLGRENTHLVESSYWLIAYETGFIGLILYYSPIIYFAYLFIFGKKRIVEQNVAYAISFCNSLAYLMLPFVASFEMQFLLYLFMGLELAERKKNQ